MLSIYLSSVAASSSSSIVRGGMPMPPAVARALVSLVALDPSPQCDTPCQTALVERYSPVVIDPERPQRRESVTVRSCDTVSDTCEVEEVLCDEQQCIALMWTVPQSAFLQALEAADWGGGEGAATSSAGHDESMARLRDVLNGSPSTVKFLALRHAFGALQPTEVLERATVTEVSLSALALELIVVDVAEMAEGGAMPRRVQPATVPLRPCAYGEDLEDVLLGMLDEESMDQQRVPTPMATPMPRESWGI